MGPSRTLPCAISPRRGQNLRACRSSEPSLNGAVRALAGKSRSLSIRVADAIPSPGPGDGLPRSSCALHGCRQAAPGFCHQALGTFPQASNRRRAREQSPALSQAMRRWRNSLTLAPRPWRRAGCCAYRPGQVLLAFGLDGTPGRATLVDGRTADNHRPLTKM